MLNLYFAKMIDGYIEKEIYPQERYEEICAVRNENVKKEKTLIWRLLELALADVGISLKDINIVKSKCGKWISPIIHFSLSHAKDALAVVISDKNVGVDIESLTSLPKSKKFAERIFTDKERESIDTSSLDARCLVSYWTAKEAAFKTLSQEAFIPSAIELDSFNIYSDVLTVSDEEYAFSVVSECISELKIKTLEL